MILTGNNVITLRKLTSKVIAEKGILPLKVTDVAETYTGNCLIGLELRLFYLLSFEIYYS